METRFKIITGIAIGIVAVMVIYAGLSGYGAFRAMEIPRLPLTASADSLGIDYENVAFNSRIDDLLLRGWFMPGGGDAAFVIVTGGYQNRVDDNIDTLGLAGALVNRGYNVLLFDMRGRGESEGVGKSMTNFERDIGGAMDFLQGRGYGLEKICLMGICSGAASSCIYASRNEVGAVILDGCFTDTTTMVTREAVEYGVPEFLLRIFSPGILFMSKLLYGYEEINPIDIIADISCPIFFIHEEHDIYIYEDEMYALYEKSTNPANEFWEIKGTKHSQPFREHPEEYIERLEAFLRSAGLP